MLPQGVPAPLRSGLRGHQSRYAAPDTGSLGTDHRHRPLAAPLAQSPQDASNKCRTLASRFSIPGHTPLNSGSMSAHAIQQQHHAHEYTTLTLKEVHRVLAVKLDE